MPDESPKEIPQEPQKSSLSSMFERWNKDRSDVTEKSELVHHPSIPDISEIGKQMYSNFFPFGDKKDRMFRNEDIGVVFHTEPEDGSFTSGSPMLVMVEIENGTESRGRMRRMTYKGKTYPEYFKDRGKIFRVVHRYDLNPNGEIKKVELITDEWTGKLSDRGIKPEDIEEIEGLFFNEFDKLSDEAKSIQRHFNSYVLAGELSDLDPADYELLKMIEVYIKEGKLKENSNYEYDY